MCGQGGIGALAATLTHHRRTLVLGNLGLHLRDFRDLMTPGFPHDLRLDQTFTTVLALLRQQYLDSLHLLHGHQFAMVAKMPRCTARSPALLVSFMFAP